MADRPSPSPLPIALHAPAQIAHDLPLQPTPLIGRHDALTTLRARLLDPNVRLLTLTGPPGTGKTRLALALAESARDHFPDGVWFVGLESVRESDQVVAAIARTLRVREAAGQDLAAALAERLADRRLLLVLDNFEQVLPAGTRVADLLAACPGLTVLVTSRVPLRLRWEHESPVTALALPDPGRTHDLDAIERSAAVQLFVQRARAAKPDFRLSADNADAVAAICRGLDGLPLTIELAASRIKLLPPRAIAERLQHRLRLLIGGAQDLPERHQTLRAAITWSYDLLTPFDQALFRCLGVFAGGITPDAAIAIAGVVAEGTVQPSDADPSVLVEDGLETLHDHSLIWIDTRPTSGPRYQMLETLREFGQDQLATSGELDSARRRHAEFFLAFAEAAEPQLDSPDQPKWLDRIEAEHDNLRAALAWVLAGVPGRSPDQRGLGNHAAKASWGSPIPNNKIELGLRLGGALWRFWRTRGYVGEGRRHLTALLAMPGAEQYPAPRAKALNRAGNLAMFQGDYDAAHALHQESLHLRRVLGLPLDIAATLNNLGIIAQLRGDYVEARRCHEESLALKQEVGDRSGIAYSLTSLGNLAGHQGNFDTAYALHAESLAIRRELREDWGIRITLVNLGNVAYLRGEYDDARAWLEESLAIARRLGDKDIGAALINLGSVALRRNDFAAARAHLTQSLATFTELGDTRGLGFGLEAWAALAVAERRPERAARLFGAAEATRERIGFAQTVGDRHLHDRDVALARAVLDGATFAAAWAAGRAMPLEAALAYALNDVQTDEPTTAAPPSPPQRAAPLPAGITAREADVLRLLASGHTNPEIARTLGISIHTVERHTVNLYAKINARGRAGAIAFAHRHGLVES